MVDERVHRDVIVGLLTAAGLVDSAAKPIVFDYGNVPGADGNAGTLPPIHLLLTVERRAAGVFRAGRAGVSGWRITLRGVGRTVDEARWALNKATGALDEQNLLIGGKTSTPVTFNISQAISKDDGRFSGLVAWTYAL
ncbi:hypothetical protein KR76_01970 [Pimelobacter simplex]|uniref:DUF3168 domain-containing protein n=1 Tax=Nocardioides simplex TaxID=2045 RepID=A0A0A1DH37_NOCSI|nr:hypothetical protein KR76_01970 [Pimelobacter simplex]